MNDISNKIELYKDDELGITIEVKLNEESLWLDQYQISELFNIDRTTIGRHISNIYKSKELDESSTCAKNAQVQMEGKRRIKREIKYYNLDVIISVGYRVNSKKGTQFRIWANKILKEYLLKGYALNERNLQQKTEQLENLKRVIAIQENIISRGELSNSETQGLIKVIHSYSKALDLLDAYDYQRLEVPEKGSKEVKKITYEEAINAIKELGKQTGATELFGKEKDDSFGGSLTTIYQTFDGKELYPTLESKVSHLLYFIVKNHSFIDGNKRIGAFVFIWFLDLNERLFDSRGERIMSEETLVALTLMIAESKAEDKEMIVKVIINLIV